MSITRRHFTQVAAALSASPLLGQRGPLTARQALDRIGQGLAITAGDPGTPVRAVATTALATMDVLKRALKENVNLVVTLEPTFFGGRDTPPADDPVYLAKKEFIAKNALVVARIGEAFRSRKPDPFGAGLGDALGWAKYREGDDPLRYSVPAGSLTALVDHLKKQLKVNAGIRVIGDPQSRVQHIALLPGVSALAATMKVLPGADVVVAGETREWESVEYAQDTVASGQKKGLILLGRVVSEEPGMNVCAQWLKTLLPKISVRWIPAGDPYWRPA